MEFMTVDQINIKLISLVRNERKLTEEILNHIILFQKCSGYLKLGYSTMHQYMTRTLGYSDDQAYRRLKASKLLQDVPDVADQLKSGEINLSQAAQTQNAIETTQKETRNLVSIEKKKKIIRAIKNENNFETKKILASELDLKPKLDEKSIPQSNKTVRLEINLTEEQFEKLKTIKSLLSHKMPSQNTAEVLEILFDQYLHKNPLTSKPKECNTSITQTTKSKAHNNSSAEVTKSKEHNNLSTQAMRPNAHRKPIIQATDHTTSKPASNTNHASADPQSTITERFMESGVQVKKVNNLNLIFTRDPNINANPDLNITCNSTVSVTPNLTYDHNINNSSESNKTKEKAKNQKFKNHNSNNQSPFKRTRSIPMHTRRKVFQRANHCCEFTGSNQVRCESRYQLEIDHFVKPYSQGGDHSLDNLKLHCSQHNLYRASRIGIGVETIKSHF